jgi:hypothetical protein
MTYRMCQYTQWFHHHLQKLWMEVGQAGVLAVSQHVDKLELKNEHVTTLHLKMVVLLA